MNTEEQVRDTLLPGERDRACADAGDGTWGCVETEMPGDWRESKALLRG